MTPRRLSRRELAIFCGGVARGDSMLVALTEVLCYRTGTLRATDRSSIRAVARKHGVAASTLDYQTRKAMGRLVTTFRYANGVNREENRAGAVQDS